MYISITGLKPKGIISYFMFWRLAIPSFKQAKIAQGNLVCEVKKINGYQCTLTAWVNKESMLAFLRSGIHLKAMKSFHKIAIGRTYGYESDNIPDWKEAYMMLEKNGKQY
jgi:hypothetical protein